MRQGKVWGQTELVLSNGSLSIHALSILPGGFCSEHRHKAKTNLFYVLSGELEITIWCGSGQIDRTLLGPGQSSFVPAGVWHKFRALRATQAIEIYESRLEEGDIERRSGGGKK